MQKIKKDTDVFDKYNEMIVWCKLCQPFNLFKNKENIWTRSHESSNQTEVIQTNWTNDFLIK